MKKPAVPTMSTPKMPPRTPPAIAPLLVWPLPAAMAAGGGGLAVAVPVHAATKAQSAS